MREITTDFAREFTKLAEDLQVISWDGAEPTDELRVTKVKEVYDVLNGIEANKGTANETALRLMREAQIEIKSPVTRDAYAKLFGEQPPGPAPAPAEQPQAAAGFFDAADSATAPADPQPAPAGFGVHAGPAPDATPAAPGAASVAGGTDIESIFPGYDDMKVAQIKELVLLSAKSGDLTLEEWEAIKAYEVAHEDRKTIRELQPEFKAPEPEPAPLPTADQAGVTQMGGGGAPEQSAVEFFANGAKEVGSDAGDGVLAAYNDETVSRVQQEGLPIPSDSPSEVAALPLDLTALSEAQITEFGSIYHSVFAHAQWALSQEEGRAAYAEHLEKETENDEFVRAYSKHQNEIPEEKRTQPTALEAARKQAEREAEVSPKVRDWRSKKVRHNVEARKLKAIVTIADKAVWRIDKELDRRARAQTTAHAAR